MPAAMTIRPGRSGSSLLFDRGTGSGNGTGDDPGLELPSNWSSLIGIVTAIVGNVLIALALNVQRYAHLQLEQRRRENRARAQQALKRVTGHGNDDCSGSSNGNGYGNGYGNRGRGDDGRGRNGSYGAADNSRRTRHRGNGRMAPVIRTIREAEGDEDRGGGNDDRMHSGNDEGQPLMACYRGDGGDDDDDRDIEDGADDVHSAASAHGSEESLGGSSELSSTASSTSYLRSPYWWLGQVLITVGEMGNFLAYGFAPASIVSPLGVVALISNCVIAPMLFKERFRLRDFWGVLVAIGGAVTVVLSAKQEETKLAPHDVWDAITTPAFEIYLALSCSLIALLMWASPRYGHRTILIDLGLVGLFGAYTVLATKGVSSMLSSTLLRAFITPMTYSLLVILLGTAVMQVRYVNKALQRFDSTQVIPIQFVMFTLSVIVGSAVLYRDFERTTAVQAAKFVGGCLLTFSGVFVITSGRPSADSDDSEHSTGQVEDGVYMDIQDEDGNSRHAAVAVAAATASAARSGSSRRSSRVVVSGASTPHLPVFSSPLGDDGDAGSSSSPWPENPWHSELADAVAGSILPSQPLSLSESETRAEAAEENAETAAATAEEQQAVRLRPLLGAPAFSADSVLQTVGDSGARKPWSPPVPEDDRRVSISGVLTSPPWPPSAAQTDRPTTPATPLRPSYHTSHFLHQSPMISPSPLLSSTVSAAVADTILKHMDGGSSAGSIAGGDLGASGIGGSSISPRSGRRLSNRRARQSLRASLFVPQGDLEDPEWLLQPFPGGQLPPQRRMSHHTHVMPIASLSTASIADDAPAGRSAYTESVRDRTRSLSQALLGGLSWARRGGSGRRSTSPGMAEDAFNDNSHGSSSLPR